MGFVILSFVITIRNCSNTNDCAYTVSRAKMVRKTLIPTVLCLLDDFLSSKNDVNEASKSNK